MRKGSGLVRSMRRIEAKLESIPDDLTVTGGSGSQLHVFPRRESGPKVVVVGGNHGENGSTKKTTKMDRVPVGGEAAEITMKRPDKDCPKSAVVGLTWIEHGLTKETAEVGNCRFSVCMMTAEEESTRRLNKWKSNKQAMPVRESGPKVAVVGRTHRENGSTRGAGQRVIFPVGMEALENSTEGIDTPVEESLLKTGGGLGNVQMVLAEDTTERGNSFEEDGAVKWNPSSLEHKSLRLARTVKSIRRTDAPVGWHYKQRTEKTSFDRTNTKCLNQIENSNSARGATQGVEQPDPVPPEAPDPPDPSKLFLSCLSDRPGRLIIQEPSWPPGVAEAKCTDRLHMQSTCPKTLSAEWGQRNLWEETRQEKFRTQDVRQSETRDSRSFRSARPGIT